jgi:hypothetical protein
MRFSRRIGASPVIAGTERPTRMMRSALEKFLCEFWRDGAVDLRRAALFVPDSLTVEEHPRGKLDCHKGGRVNRLHAMQSLAA